MVDHETVQELLEQIDLIKSLEKDEQLKVRVTQEQLDAVIDKLTSRIEQAFKDDFDQRRYE
jgi:hypothetical protein